MNSLSQTTDERQTIGPPFITCVDIDGTQTPSTALWYGPSEAIDPTDAAGWPAWTDNFFWSITDEADLAEMEAEEVERLAELADAPRASWTESLWAQLMIEGSLPAISGGSPTPTPSDRAEFDAWLASVDRPYPPDDQLEDGMAFPRGHTAATRAAFQADIIDHYRSHPDA